MKADSPLVTKISPSPNFGDRRGKAVNTLILHYTGMSTGARALARLRDPTSQVSCHFFVWEDGQIDQLVAERDRAWHAGRAFWAGERDMNAVSIGVEIVNAGHDGGCLPYPAAQIRSVVSLCRDIQSRHVIAAGRILAHSDVAPERKVDPGEWFPWATLAAAGVGLWVDPPPPAPKADLLGPTVLDLQSRLADIGYDCAVSGVYDAKTANVIAAFQRHYRPARVDGAVDASTITAIERLVTLRL